MRTQTVKSFRVRESKFGQTLVLETFAKSGGYVLGEWQVLRPVRCGDLRLTCRLCRASSEFRIDPIEKLEAVMKEMKSFHSLFSRYNTMLCFVACLWLYGLWLYGCGYGVTD